jgi:hypothetical protein
MTEIETTSLAEETKKEKKLPDPMWGFTYLEFGGLICWFFTFLILATVISLAAADASVKVLGAVGVAGACLGGLGVCMFGASWLEGRQHKAHAEELKLLREEIRAERVELELARAPKKRAPKAAKS